MKYYLKTKIVNNIVGTNIGKASWKISLGKFIQIKTQQMSSFIWTQLSGQKCVCVCVCVSSNCSIKKSEKEEGRVQIDWSPYIRNKSTMKGLKRKKGVQRKRVK